MVIDPFTWINKFAFPSRIGGINAPGDVTSTVTTGMVRSSGSVGTEEGKEEGMEKKIVGRREGGETRVNGFAVGGGVGLIVVGADDGRGDGNRVGLFDGITVDGRIEGILVGVLVVVGLKLRDSRAEGTEEGQLVVIVGNEEGKDVTGCREGLEDGEKDGDTVKLVG
jgi:hypothetical protein